MTINCTLKLPVTFLILDSIRKELLVKYGISDETQLHQILQLEPVNPRSIDFYINLLLGNVVQYQKPEDIIPHLPEPIKNTIATNIISDMLRYDVMELNADFLKAVREDIRTLLNTDSFIEDYIKNMVKGIADSYKETYSTHDQKPIDLEEYVYRIIYKMKDHIVDQMKEDLFDYIEKNIQENDFIKYETAKNIIMEILDLYLFGSLTGEQKSFEDLFLIITERHYDEPVFESFFDPITLGTAIVLYFVEEKFKEPYALHHFIKNVVKDYIERDPLDIQSTIESKIHSDLPRIRNIAHMLVEEYMSTLRWSEVVDSVLREIK